MKIISVVGARPNFMKIAPLVHAIDRHNTGLVADTDCGGSGVPADGSSLEGVQGESQTPPARGSGGGKPPLPKFIDHILVHTGQHYDVRMSQAFFEQLGIPAPDINLEIGSGSHAEQVGQTMMAFEKVLQQHRPDWVIVVGDVNATCACSITAKKEHVKVAHIEAGLRSFDLDMPEEINRMVTDRLSDLLFTTDEIASQNLRNEGVPDEKIKQVGNIMIDTLEANRARAAALEIAQIIEDNRLNEARGGEPGTASSAPPAWGVRSTPQTSRAVAEKESTPRPAATKPAGRRQVGPGAEPRSPFPLSYALMTMHRPSNVDEKAVLEPIMRFLMDEVAADLPLLWPIHPRSQKRLQEFGLWDDVVHCGNLILLQPVGYHEMLRLNMDAQLMLTDSGGLQEECCVLGTPCLTLRANTERPVTLTEHGGASILVGNNCTDIRAGYAALRKLPRQPSSPPLWDGRTAERIVGELAKPENR